MSKTVNDKAAKKELFARISALTPNSAPKWGKMNSHQAVCHLTDQLRDLDGSRPVKYEGNPVLKFIVRPILSRIDNWPKGVFPAAKGYDQLKEGTPPIEFTKDKELLLRMLKELSLEDETKQLPLHPAFGKLTHKQYARIVYKHFDHHLKQFGV